MRILKISFLFVLLSAGLFARGNSRNFELINLYPLEVGNMWVYIDSSVVHSFIEVSIAVVEVVGDSLAPNGKLYYDLKEGTDHFLERIDSTEGKLYRYYEHPILPENEYVIADLQGEVGDTMITFDPPNSQAYLIVIGVDTFYNWGLTKFRKRFFKLNYPVFRYFSFTEDIGLDYSDISIAIGSAWGSRTLKGCIINGVTYGDPSPVEQEITNSPLEFYLFQNFPNPFNPVTKISWQSPAGSWQTLKIYDVLGNEVAILVDEYKPASDYEVEFNGSNYTIGIYYYQLNSGEFTETKKMVLLK